MGLAVLPKRVMFLMLVTSFSLSLSPPPHRYVVQMELLMKRTGRNGNQGRGLIGGSVQDCSWVRPFSYSQRPFTRFGQLRRSKLAQKKVHCSH